MTSKFIIIDGNSLTYRAFHALPMFHTADGLHTNAVYGFTTMLVKILDDFKPERLAVAFDKSRVTFRTQLYKEYKANRKATPPELSEQMPLIEELLTAWNIKSLKLEGYEADDIIGTLANKAAQENWEVLIVTGDRDILQLINDKVKVLLTNKGVSEVSVMDEKTVREKYGISPEQIIDLKGLMGDKSDNIPGVAGIGEKTAVKLLKEFGSLETILENLDKVTGKKVQTLLRENEEQALLSKKLATIAADMSLEFEPDQFLFAPDKEAVKDIFRRLDFKSLLAKLNSIFPEPITTQTSQPGLSEEKNRPQLSLMALAARPVESVSDFKTIKNLYTKIKKTKKVSCYPVVTGKLPLVEFESITLTIPEKTIYIQAGCEAWPVVLDILADKKIEKITHDGKILYNACQAQNIQLENLSFDTMLAAYLLDPTALDYPLRSLAAFYGVSEKGEEDYNITKVDSLNCSKTCAAQASNVIYDLEPVLKKRLEEAELYKLFIEVEMPLIEVLSAMEHYGIKVDKERLQVMSNELAARLNVIVAEIYKLSGEQFNLNSPKQLGAILFDKLGLPALKKTKTGYSTDAEVLEKLAGAHPIVDNILEYRTLSKLKSTYLDGMEPLIRSQTGRIHTTFNQMVTVTGRLSSSEPNLQNIPIRTDIGRKIRELFVAGEEFSCLMSADYSQIELRILADMSSDEKLLDAFNQNQDIHARTAAEVFGVSLSEVTSIMRSRAKAVNFGIVYGISDYGLARDLGVSRNVAGEYISNYFAKYWGVKDYIDTAITEAREKGFVTTPFGRRRFLPDINSSNYNRRAFAERTAMNTPIQGAAADIIKLAMIEVYRALKKSSLKSRLLLQVHDELVLEIFRGEEDQIEKMVKDIMENTVSLKINLSVDVARGLNWAEAK